MSTLIESLLYQSEGTALDFKKEQYSFQKATDEQKSELLKDILAFANSWRQNEAYIVIGVEEVVGGRHIPVGEVLQQQPNPMILHVWVKILISIYSLKPI